MEVLAGTKHHRKENDVGIGVDRNHDRIECDVRCPRHVLIAGLEPNREGSVLVDDSADRAVADRRAQKPDA